MLQHVGAHDDVKGLVGQRHVRNIRNDVNVRIAVPRDILIYGQPNQNSEVWRKKMGYNGFYWRAKPLNVILKLSGQRIGYRFFSCPLAPLLRGSATQAAIVRSHPYSFRVLGLSLQQRCRKTDPAMASVPTYSLASCSGLSKVQGACP